MSMAEIIANEKEFLERMEYLIALSIQENQNVKLEQVIAH